MFRLSKDIDSAFQGVGTKGYASFLFNAIHEKKIVCLFPLMLVLFLAAWRFGASTIISLYRSPSLLSEDSTLEMLTFFSA